MYFFELRRKIKRIFIPNHGSNLLDGMLCSKQEIDCPAHPKLLQHPVRRRPIIHAEKPHQVRNGAAVTTGKSRNRKRLFKIGFHKHLKLRQPVRNLLGHRIFLQQQNQIVCPMFQLLENPVVTLSGQNFERVKQGLKFFHIHVRQIIFIIQMGAFEHLIQQIPGKNQRFLDAESGRPCHEFKISSGTQQKKIILLREKHLLVLPNPERTFLNMFQRQKVGIDPTHVTARLQLGFPDGGTPEHRILRFLRKKSGVIPSSIIPSVIGTPLLFHLKAERVPSKNGCIRQNFHGNEKKSNGIYRF